MTLRLRAFTKEDISPLTTWFKSEIEVRQWAGASLSYPLQARDFKALINRHKAGGPDAEIWAIETENGVMIGHAQLSYNLRLHQATLGRVAIAPEKQGQGLSANLIRLAIDRAFSWTWVNRLELRVYDFNKAAISAYRKAGFTYEGTRRQSTPVGGTYWNTDVMSLLREEYNQFDKRTERE
ncbi:MAG: hypothetical protein Hens3KO_07500 [Henriciella sp.]